MRFLRTFALAALFALQAVSPASGMETDVKAAGSYHKATTIDAKVGGVWVGAKSMWTNVSGTWRQVYGSFTPVTDKVYAAATPLNALTTGSLTVPTGASHVVIKFQSSGGPGCDSSCGITYAGGGGGYAVYAIDLTSADWGKSVSYSLHNRTYSFNDSGYNFSYDPDVASASFTNGSMSLSCRTGGRGYDGAGYSSGPASGGNVSNTDGGAASGTQGGSAGDGTPGATNGQGDPGAGGGPQRNTGYGGEAYIEADWS